MRRPSNIIRRSSTCWGFLVVLVIAVVTIVKNSLTLQGGGSSSSSSEKTNKSVTTTTATTTEKEKNPAPADGNEPLFLLPSKNDFRPVTSLSRTCTPDPSHHQQIMQSIQTFSEYSNSSVFFGTTTTTFKINDDNNVDDDLLTICEFIPKDNAMHFAHSMQQLYGCYSYWQTTNNIHQEHRRRRRPVLIMPSSKVQTKLETNPFLKGYLRLLQDSSFGLDIITKKQYKEKYVNNRNSTTNHDDNHHIQTIDVSGGYILSHVKELNNLLLEDGRKDNPSSNSYLFSSQATIRPEQQQQQQPDCVTSSSRSTPRIGILNRRKSVGRSIINVQILVDTLSEITNNTIPVEYFEEKTFDKQIEFFANVDILISPHGAQLTGLPFMLFQQQHPEASFCSYLLEIFPKQYALPNFYGSLATNSGIKYSYLYLSNKSYQDERQSETVAERIHARAQDLCPSPDLMLKSIQNLIHQWEECMSCNGNNN